MVDRSHHEFVLGTDNLRPFKLSKHQPILFSARPIRTSFAQLQCLHMNSAAQTVGSILSYPRKVNSYKLVLIRSINGVVLSHPELLAWA
jgi:hypothetical protein